MTDQEKARAYDEAIDRAKKKCHYPNQPCYVEVGEIFHELRESEDERIRKDILRFLKAKIENCTSPTPAKSTLSMWIAYLEKQKEQKPAEKQDYSGLNDLERAIHRGFLVAGVENVPVTIIKETAKDCLAQIKPAEWSKEEQYAISDWYHEHKVVFDKYGNAYLTSSELEEFAKFCFSLRPSWKPSEEQMKALFLCIPKSGQPCTLQSLYNDLKKL